MKIVHRDHRVPSVRDLMSRTLSAVDPRQTLFEAAALMRRLQVSSLVVLDGQEATGILTERDLVRALADGRDPGDTHVSQYMTQSPIAVDLADRAAEAALLMERHHVRHLLVTDRGRVAGCISVRDLLRLHVWPGSLDTVEPW
jgi:CBS domain-containing protein